MPWKSFSGNHHNLGEQAEPTLTIFTDKLSVWLLPSIAWPYFVQYYQTSRLLVCVCVRVFLFFLFSSARSWKKIGEGVGTRLYLEPQSRIRDVCWSCIREVVVSGHKLLLWARTNIVKLQAGYCHPSFQREGTSSSCDQELLRYHFVLAKIFDCWIVWFPCLMKQGSHSWHELLTGKV